MAESLGSSACIRRGAPLFNYKKLGAHLSSPNLRAIVLNEGTDRESPAYCAGYDRLVQTSRRVVDISPYVYVIVS